MYDIPGQFIAGHALNGDEAPEAVFNPATGAEIASLASANRAQVDAAVAAAEKAFAIWSKMPPKERSLRMLKIADRIEAMADEFAALEMTNCGKPIGTVKGVDVGNTVDVFRFFAGAARTVPGVPAGEYRAGHTSMLRRDPLGVCVGIAPWNYPLMMASWKIAPVIAAGNTVVLKPSEHTPLTALKLAEVCAEFLPEGVVNVVTGNGANVGARLVADPRVRMVSLTGDVSTGRKILEAVAPTIKRTHFELGGKAPVIVLGDADVAAAVEAIAEGGFYNAGQDCTAACRVYAHAKIHDRLVADLQAAIGHGDGARLQAEVVGQFQIPGPQPVQHHFAQPIGRQHRQVAVQQRRGFGRQAVDAQRVQAQLVGPDRAIGRFVAQGEIQIQHAAVAAPQRRPADGERELAAQPVLLRQQTQAGRLQVDVEQPSHRIAQRKTLRQRLLQLFGRDRVPGTGRSAAADRPGQPRAGGAAGANAELAAVQGGRHGGRAGGGRVGAPIVRRRRPALLRAGRVRLRDNAAFPRPVPPPRGTP